MPCQTEDRKTLNDLTVDELLRSAQSELLALGDRLDRLHPRDLVTRAYLGSVGARIAVAETKLREANR